MKTIIVFGASGGTGTEVINQSLEKNFGVTAVLRNPDAFEIKHDHLHIVKGDVLQLASFEKEMAGKDAVISCIGTGSNLKPTKVYSLGIENILNAMSTGNVHRLICISAGALEATREMGFFIRLLTKQVLQKILKNIYTDMQSMEKILTESNVDYTIMRPARLTNKKRTGKYRIGINGHIKIPWTIGKADPSHFMLSIIGDAQTFKSIIEIAY